MWLKIQRGGIYSRKGWLEKFQLFPFACESSLCRTIFCRNMIFQLFLLPLKWLMSHQLENILSSAGLSPQSHPLCKYYTIIIWDLYFISIHHDACSNLYRLQSKGLEIVHECCQRILTVLAIENVFGNWIKLAWKSIDVIGIKMCNWSRAPLAYAMETPVKASQASSTEMTAQRWLDATLLSRL